MMCKGALYYLDSLNESRENILKELQSLLTHSTTSSRNYTQQPESKISDRTSGKEEVVNPSVSWFAVRDIVNGGVFYFLKDNLLLLLFKPNKIVHVFTLHMVCLRF